MIGAFIADVRIAVGRRQPAVSSSTPSGAGSWPLVDIRPDDRGIVDRSLHG